MTTTGKVREAIDWAAELHGGQRRKGSGVPYLFHLLAVAALVADHGGTETEVLGAVLHDVIEDCAHDHPGLRDELVRRFGEDVAAIVDACSDAEGEPKPPWRERKTGFVASLQRAGPSVRLVVAADKLHNATCTVRDLRAHGDEVWQRFRGGRNGTVWYYGAVRDALADGWDHPILGELSAVVAELQALGAAADVGGAAGGGAAEV